MTNSTSKRKSASHKAAPLGTLVKILYMTLFPTEKKKEKVEIVKIRMKIHFLHKYIPLFGLPFLNYFNMFAQL